MLRLLVIAWYHDCGINADAKAQTSLAAAITSMTAAFATVTAASQRVITTCVALGIAKARLLGDKLKTDNSVTWAFTIN